MSAARSASCTRRQGWNDGPPSSPWQTKSVGFSAIFVLRFLAQDTVSFVLPHQPTQPSEVGDAVLALVDKRRVASSGGRGKATSSEPGVRRVVGRACCLGSRHQHLVL